MEFRNSVAVLARGLNPCTPVGSVVGCVDHLVISVLGSGAGMRRRARFGFDGIPMVSIHPSHICHIGATDQGQIAENYRGSVFTLGRIGSHQGYKAINQIAQYAGVLTHPTADFRISTRHRHQSCRSGLVRRHLVYSEELGSPIWWP